jgi:hypothetical protein
MQADGSNIVQVAKVIEIVKKDAEEVKNDEPPKLPIGRILLDKMWKN